MLDYKFTFPPVSTIKRYPLSNIDVLVVGGGIGGMFAAINCYQKGHNVRVLEAASGFDINGISIKWRRLLTPANIMKEALSV